MSFFQDARNVDISGSRLFAINGDNNSISMGSGIQALSLAISHGAMHDSSERDPPPRCHPGTRKKVSEDIVHWLEDSETSTSVLWVNGRAGVGKSALMQTIAELLLANNLDFGGCFFFKRKVLKCDKKGFLFATLAYQLAINVGGMREYINKAMEDNPALPTRSAAIQLEQLILKPFMRLPIPRPSPVIIIDGLDECDGSEAQRDILSLISQASSTPEITIRFIIASRPEYQITQMFNKEPLLRMTHRLVLDEDYESLSDIKIYLRDGFTQIREQSDMNCSQDPWPSDDQVEQLAWRASGQFIYAATVLKFVGSEFCDPADHLDIILHPSPMQAAAFSELDRLYTQILSVYPDPGFMKSVLGVIALFESEIDTAKPSTYSSFMADILGTEEGKVCAVLRSLRSLTVPGARGNAVPSTMQEPFHPVHFAHKSFADFLMDETRSRQYSVDFDAFQSQILCRIFDLVVESVQSPLKPTTSIQISTWQQFQAMFRPLDDNANVFSVIGWIRPSSRIALHRNFNELRSALSDVHLQQIDAPAPYMFCALQFACSTLNVLRIHPLLPEMHNTMDKLFVDTQNLLDICYRQTLGTSILNPTFLIGHLALDFSVTHSSHLHPPRARNYTVEEICNTWNISNRLVQNFLHDNSHLLDSCGSADGTPMSYTACSDLRAFCTNPSRAQHLYQHFWTLRVRKCQEAIFQVINLTSDASKADDFCRQDIHLAFGIRDYFGQNHGISSTSAGILDLQNVENVAAHMALQNLLKLLSEVSWAELFLMTTASTMMTLVIASWVCHYLESSSGGPSDSTQDMVEAIYQQILTHGILPKFREQAILIEDFLNDDEMIQDCILELPKYDVDLGSLNSARMQLLFKDIMHELLDTAMLMQNLTLPFGTTSLEKFLFQRLKLLLLPAAGLPMSYWHALVWCVPESIPNDGQRLTLAVLLLLSLDLPQVDPSPFLYQ